jgi:hypothetical protein
MTPPNTLKVPMKLRGGLEVLNQQALQYKGDFKQGDKHPIYPSVLFRANRSKTMQQWCLQQHIDKAKRRSKGYYKENKAAYYERNKKWGEENKDRLRELQRNWAKTDKGRVHVAAKAAKRRGDLKNNMKLTADTLAALKDVYHTRDALTLAARSAGSLEDYHVDHIMPLLPSLINFNGTQQRPYTGLHAPWNLQILEAKENISKSNRVLPSEC